MRQRQSLVYARVLLLALLLGDPVIGNPANEVECKSQTAHQRIRPPLCQVLESGDPIGYTALQVDSVKKTGWELVREFVRTFDQAAGRFFVAQTNSSSSHPTRLGNPQRGRGKPSMRGD
jgi:hypothetical protein